MPIYLRGIPAGAKGDSPGGAPVGAGIVTLVSLTLTPCLSKIYLGLNIFHASISPSHPLPPRLNYLSEPRPSLIHRPQAILGPNRGHGAVRGISCELHASDHTALPRCSASEFRVLAAQSVLG